MPFVQGSAVEKARLGSLERRVENISDLIQAEYPDVPLNIVATFDKHVLAFNDEGRLRKIGYEIGEDNVLVIKSDRQSREIPVISDAEVPAHVARELRSITRKMMEGKKVSRTQVREVSAMLDPDEDYWMSDVLSKMEESMGDSEWFRMYDANMEGIRTSLYGRVREIEGKAPRVYYSKISSDRLSEFDEEIRESMSLLHSLYQEFCERCIGFSFDEKQEFLNELGLNEPGLNRVIRAGYELLGLQTYFTAGPKEAKAWTFPKGIFAPQAAAIIHTDFERGFIRAEVISYDDYIKYNGEQGAKEAGKMRLEGKTYIVQDGDVVHFRFNV